MTGRSFTASPVRVCSELYATLMALLPKDYHAFVNMYHTNTENGVQEKIIREISTPTGELRILIATIAYGMGVDSSTVHSTLFGGGPGTMHIC